MILENYARTTIACIIYHSIELGTGFQTVYNLAMNFSKQRHTLQNCHYLLNALSTISILYLTMKKYCDGKEDALVLTFRERVF